MANRLGKKQSPGKAAVQLHSNNKFSAQKKQQFAVTGLGNFDARQKLSKPKMMQSVDVRQKLQQKTKFTDARTRIEIKKLQHQKPQQQQPQQLPQTSNVQKVANLSMTDMRIKINNAKGKKMDAREMLKAKRGLKEGIPPKQQVSHQPVQIFQNQQQQSEMGMANTKVILTDNRRLVGQGGASGVVAAGGNLVKTISSNEVATWDDGQQTVGFQKPQPLQFQRRGQLQPHQQQQQQQQPQHLQTRPQQRGTVMPFSKTISNPTARPRIAEMTGNNIVFNTSQNQQQLQHQRLQQQQHQPQYQQQHMVNPSQQDSYIYTQADRHFTEAEPVEFEAEEVQDQYDLNEDFPVIQIENDSFQTYSSEHQIQPVLQRIQQPQRIQYAEPVEQRIQPQFGQMHPSVPPPLMQRVQPEVQAEPQQRGGRLQVFSHMRHKALVTKPKPSPIRFPSSLEKSAVKITSPLATETKKPDDTIDLASGDFVSPLQGYRVLISNLHTIVTQDDVVELFGAAGALKKARLIKPGVSEVVYVKREDALAAVRQYHQRELDGKPMQVVMTSAPKPKPPPVELEVKPLILTKAEPKSEPANPLDIDVGLLHKALFKTVNKDEQPTKPVTFTVKI